MSGLQGFLSKTNAVYVELTHIHCIWCNTYLLCVKQIMMMYHSIGSGEAQQQKEKKIRKESSSSLSFSCLSFFSDLQIPSGGTLHNRSRYQLLSLMFWNPCSSLFQEDVTLCSHIEIWKVLWKHRWKILSFPHLIISHEVRGPAPLTGVCGNLGSHFATV